MEKIPVILEKIIVFIFSLAAPSLLLRVGGWVGGTWRGVHQLESALCRAHTRGGRGVRVLPDPYLGERSVGGLALGLACPSIRLPVCVCVWGGGAWRGRGVRV